MRQVSKKRAARNRECVAWRQQLIARVRRCEVCGRQPWLWDWYLCVHEIARGTNREKAIDQAYAVLVVDHKCHEELGSKKEWPVSRQLWALRRSRPQDFDLAAYLALAHPNAPLAITPEEIDAWTDTL